MMKFRTEIVLPKYPFNITYQDKLFFIGSCFSDYIGAFFQKNQFITCLNPFGTLFNPISIKNALFLLCGTEIDWENYIYQFDKQWVSFLHHGKFSHSDKSVFLDNIQKNIEESTLFLRETDYLFITFGTAFVYNFIERDLVVSNCHKIPGNKFDKIRLTVDEIVNSYILLIKKIHDINPTIKIIFTVSPVRHLGDGFHENQISKSILHLSIELLTKEKMVFYFPVYEIINDDLRDYRYYSEDLCHIGENARQYIQEVLMQAFFDEETRLRQKMVEKENKFLNHRVIRGQ